MAEADKQQTEAPEDAWRDGPGALANVPWPALGRLAALLGMLVGASLLPYTTARLDNYRYWDRVDAAPIRGALTMRAPQKPDDFAPAGMPAHDQEELSGDQVLQLAGAGPSQPLPKVASPTTGLSGSASETVAPAQPLPPNPMQVDAVALGDQKVWLSGNDNMAPFYQALEQLTAHRRPKVRIAHYGDSHIANDGLTNITRQLLQARFGDGGHGFTLVQGRTEWYVHKGLTRGASEGWHLVNFLNGNARDGAYGYGGVAVEGGAGEWFSLDTTSKHRAAIFSLYYKSLGKAIVAVRIDGKAARELHVTAAAGTDAVANWEVSDGPHSIQWRVTSGRVKWYGGAAERSEGLIYDSLGEVGARGTRWLNADEHHLQAQIQQRPVDLLIVNYGGNERMDKISEQSYLDKMTKVIGQLRGDPLHTACLVLGPGDHGAREKGKIISDPDIVRINNWQRKLAPLAHCAFLDARALMGGEGGMGRWVKQGLGWSDWSHFTGKGEQVMGLAVYRALLQGIFQYQQGLAGAAPGHGLPAQPTPAQDK